jgi:hypothetical protein
MRAQADEGALAAIEAAMVQSRDIRSFGIKY